MRFRNDAERRIWIEAFNTALRAGYRNAHDLADQVLQIHRDKVRPEPTDKITPTIKLSWFRRLLKLITRA